MSPSRAAWTAGRSSIDVLMGALIRQGPSRRFAKTDRMSTMTEARSNPLARIDWDYVEFYVGNAKQAAHFYMSAFGFDQIAYAGPETGVKNRASYVLEQNKIRFVLTSSLQPDDEISKHVMLHGDGVKDIAITVEDARAAYEQAIAGVAKSVHAPAETKDEHGTIVKATVATYGDT